MTSLVYEIKVSSERLDSDIMGFGKVAMFINKPPDLEEIIKALKGDIRRLDWGTETLRCELFFGISASDCLKYAEKDLLESSSRNLTNAILNANRAINCRINELLLAYCLQLSLEKEKELPNWKKIKVLRTVDKDIPIDKSIEKLLSREVHEKRNSLEHQQIRPSQQGVRDAVALTRLFLEATNRYLEDVISHVEFQIREVEWPRKQTESMETSETPKYNVFHRAYPYTGKSYCLDFYRKKKTMTIKREQRIQGAIYDNLVTPVKLEDCSLDSLVELMVLLQQKCEEVVSREDDVVG